MKYGIVSSAILLLLASPGTNPTQAAGPPVTSVTAELIVVYGNNEYIDIDPKIPYEAGPALAKPPFSTYSGYTLLQRRTYTLPIGSPVSHTLKNGGKAVFSFKEIIKIGNLTKYLITQSIIKKNGKPHSPLVELTVKSGEFYFFNGLPYKDGVQVVGIKLLPEKP